MFKKHDVILIGVILLIGAGFLFWRHISNDTAGEVIAEITSEHGVYILSLDDAGIFYLESLPNVVFEILNNEIAFIESDCPDQICVHSGFVGRTGQAVACLPNRVLLLIIASDSDAVDM